jgi:hypothetical protein
MFARMLEGNIKFDRKQEFLKTVNEDVLPSLKKQPGFVDILGLEVETEPTRFHAITLWYARADVERYEREFFPKVKNLLEPFLTTPLMVKLCTVETTVSEKVIANVAA